MKHIFFQMKNPRLIFLKIVEVCDYSKYIKNKRFEKLNVFN